MVNFSSSDSEVKRIEELQARGFTANYRLKGDQLQDTSTGKSYKPNEIYIVEEHRFEGMSNPDDMSILYATETIDNEKGLILMPYGPTADSELVWFMKKVELRDHV